MIHNGMDMTLDLSAVASSDMQRLVTFPGDNYTFTFALPEHERDQTALFLNATGYYLEWIRGDWLAGKDERKLRGLLREDKETWATLAREFKAVEAEMETIFWNSKYAKHDQFR